MDHLHDSFSLHRRGTLEDAKNWKTGSAAHDSTLLLATRIPSARVQPRLSFGRGTTHWCSTGPRSYSVSGSNAPLLKRPLCRCGSIVRPFHPCWSAPTAPVDYSFRNELLKVILEALFLSVYSARMASTGDRRAARSAG